MTLGKMPVQKCIEVKRNNVHISGEKEKIDLFPLHLCCFDCLFKSEEFTEECNQHTSVFLPRH